MPTTTAPPLTLAELAGHIDGYTDPAKLAAHLRSRVHNQIIHAAWDGHLDVLTGAHRLAHHEDRVAARAAGTDDPAPEPDAFGLCGCGRCRCWEGADGADNLCAGCRAGRHAGDR